MFNKFLVIYSLFIIPSYAIVDLNNFFPFGYNEGDSSINGGDDPAKIFLSGSYKFFGLFSVNLWVNVNGAISFNEEIDQFPQTCKPIQMDFSVIGPFWADTETGTTGNTYFRLTKDPAVLKKANLEIENAFPDSGTVNLKQAIVATWFNITYYAELNNQFGTTIPMRSTFQTCLATDGVNSYTIFYYNKMLSVTGDADSKISNDEGFPIRVGFDAGDGINRYYINDFCQKNIKGVLMNDSNVGKAGVWVFNVGENKIIVPPTRKLTTTRPATQNSTPQFSTPSTNISVLTNSLSNMDGTPCNCNKSTMWLDLILIADRSSSIGVGGLAAIGTQLATNLYGINIAQSGSDLYSRIGLIVFSSTVEIIANLTTYNSYNDVVNDLFNLESYHETDDNVVNIYEALNTAQNMFQQQSNSNPNRNARQVVLLFASSYNQIGENNPVVIANQMNNSNIFIITVDYQDAQGAATLLLSQIATPFMNFSSADNTNLDDTFTEINNALCYSNCICPASMTQLITYNMTSGRQIYWSDCFVPMFANTFAQFAEIACEEIQGSLVTLQTSAKTSFVLNNVANNKQKKLNRFHTGLYRDKSNNWVWHGYDKTSFNLGAYMNWAPGINAYSAGNCVYMEKYGSGQWGWVTENCIGHFPYQYICQIRACDSTYATCDCTTWKNDPSCQSV